MLVHGLSCGKNSSMSIYCPPGKKEFSKCKTCCSGRSRKAKESYMQHLKTQINLTRSDPLPNLLYNFAVIL